MLVTTFGAYQGTAYTFLLKNSSDVTRKSCCCLEALNPRPDKTTLEDKDWLSEPISIDCSTEPAPSVAEGAASVAKKKMQNLY